MTLSRGFVRNAVTTPLDARLMDMAGIVCNADGTPRPGVFGGAAPTLVTTLATMNVSIAAAEFVTTKGRADGVAIFTNDGVATLPITAAPVSNSRITVIWVKHYDSTTGDGISTPAFGTTDGTAASIPTKPAIPTGALELATLRVYSGTTATNGGANTLTNTFQMTASRGGVVIFRTLVDRDAWTNPVDGQLAHVVELDATYEWVDSSIKWVHVGGKPVVTGFSYQAGYSAESDINSLPARVVEQVGRVFLEGRIVSTPATFTAGVFTHVATIADTTKWPSKSVSMGGNVNDIFGTLRVGIDGRITFTPSQTFTGPLQLNLLGTSWTDKRLA